MSLMQTTLATVAAEEQMQNLTGPELYQAWQQLKQTHPRLRARDVAETFGVTEAELVASRLGVDTVRLRPQWKTLLPALAGLGKIMALTRNQDCVHERKGVYRETSIMPNEKMGLVVSADIDLRLFLSGWSSVFAIAEATAQGVQRSIQFFDHQGVAVHKVFLTEDSDVVAWERLIHDFTAAEQTAELQLKPKPPAVVELPDTQIDQDRLQQKWSELKDTHHFYALLQKHQVTRTQALRLAGSQWAEELPVEAIAQVFERAAEQQVPIMVFVSNRHCVQIHSGPVSNLRWVGDWFNVLDPEFNLHLKVNAIKQLWRVRKPSTDGLITSWEAFDSAGNLIVQLFGARKPGIPELASWRAIAEQTPALEA